MKKYAGTQAFLTGFLDGFGCVGQYIRQSDMKRRHVFIKLASGAQVSPLLVVRRRTAFLQAQRKLKELDGYRA